MKNRLIKISVIYPKTKINTVICDVCREKNSYVVVNTYPIDEKILQDINWFVCDGCFTSRSEMEDKLNVLYSLRLL